MAAGCDGATRAWLLFSTGGGGGGIVGSGNEGMLFGGKKRRKLLRYFLRADEFCRSFLPSDRFRGRRFVGISVVVVVAEVVVIIITNVGMATVVPRNDAIR